MPRLNKAQMSKAIKKYVVRFVPKYREFSILQNNIEDVVKKSKQMWKIKYGLATAKEGEQEPIEVKDDDNEGDTIHHKENNLSLHSLVYREKMFSSTFFTLSILVANATCVSVMSLYIFSFTLL